MIAKRLVLASIVCLVAFACSQGRVPGSTSSPIASLAPPPPSPQATHSPASPPPLVGTPTPVSSGDATVEPDPTVVVSEGLRAVSAPQDAGDTQLFWRAVTPGGEYGEEYDTLQQIVEDVDLIVVGSIAELYVADVKSTDGTYPQIWAEFRVSDVLKGQPASRVSGFVDVALSPAGSWEYAADNVPDEEVILFLMNEAAYRERYGQVSVDPEAEQYMYWRPNPQGFLRNVDGQVDVFDRDRMATDYGRQDFPMTTVGHEFRDVIEAIRSAAE
jgi:hypothetical protein